MYRGSSARETSHLQRSDRGSSVVEDDSFTKESLVKLEVSSGFRAADFEFVRRDGRLCD